MKLIRILSSVSVATVVSTLVSGCAAAPGGAGLEDITLWDYLELLFVPVALGLGAYWLNRSMRGRELQYQDAQQERALRIESLRAQDEALQAYLDQISQLLTDKDRPLHRAELHDSLSTVARARTLTVLTRLDDGERKGSALKFLSESGLITGDHPILDLSGADLSRTTVAELGLRGALLDQTNFILAILPGADLRDANLDQAMFTNANFTLAKFGGAYLRGAGFGDAFLLGADFKGAYLNIANFEGANLSNADLEGAYLGNTTLEELEQSAKALEGATLPNGQKYEDWLKDKESREVDGGTTAPRNSRKRTSEKPD